MNLAILTPLSAIAFLVCGLLDSSVAQEKIALDLTKPASWSETVARSNDQLAEQTKLLIGVAKDVKRPDSERREAIYALAKIGNRESLEYLVSNLTLKLEVGIITGDEDRLKATACVYALREFAKDNWNVAAVIFASLDGSRSDLQLGYSASILKRILGKKAATALIDANLTADLKPNHKSNLLGLKRALD